MKPSGHQFTSTFARAVTVAALGAAIAFAPSAALAVDKASKPSREDRVEMRIKSMHSQLKITPAQEPQWAKVMEVMRDNAKSMDKLTKARYGSGKPMTAVDDLKSYGEITDAHADAIKRLVPAFATLYADMSDGQKKTADTVFRYGERKKPKAK